jgi:hypothetical protein
MLGFAGSFSTFEYVKKLRRKEGCNPGKQHPISFLKGGDRLFNAPEVGGCVTLYAVEVAGNATGLRLKGCDPFAVSIFFAHATPSAVASTSVERRRP